MEGIKGASSSAQMSLMRCFSPDPGVCVADSVPTHPNLQGQVGSGRELSRAQATLQQGRGPIVD